DTAGNWDVNYVPLSFSDVIIPASGVTNEPSVLSSNPTIYSLNIANVRTLTLTGHTLTLSGTAASDLTFNNGGMIVGGALQLGGAGPHLINNAAGTGSIAPTNTITVLSPAVVTLQNNLQADSLTINAGGTLDISNRQ